VNSPPAGEINADDGDPGSAVRADTEPVSTAVMWATHLLGLLLLILGGGLLYILVALWPAVQQVPAQETGSAASSVAAEAAGTLHLDARETVTLFGALKLRLTTDTALLVLVIAAGALGACIHVATSFATFVGNSRLRTSWMWWYLLRPLIGASLALLFYYAVRGGVMSSQAQSGDVNPYGVAALAALVGLFSKQAADKLREVFETLFRTAEGVGDDERKDKATFPNRCWSASSPGESAVGSRRPCGSRARDSSISRRCGSHKSTPAPVR
jgi:hypothetical protein